MKVTSYEQLLCVFTLDTDYLDFMQKVCYTTKLCHYGYSRILKIVPVQNIDTVQNAENCSSAKH